MILYKLWALLTRQETVCLRDYDGVLTYTFAFDTPYGKMAKRHWPFNIKNVNLLEGGKVEYCVYVEEWRKV